MQTSTPGAVMYRSPQDAVPTSNPVRRHRRGRLWKVGAALVVALALGLGAVHALPGWLNPFGSNTVDRSTTPLLVQLREVRQFRAATGTFQVLVDVEESTEHVPTVISGERTTLFATGSVDALVDFSTIDESRVTTSDDRRSVTFALPSPTFGPAALDPAQSRVVGRERGLVQRLGDVVGADPIDDQPLYTEAGHKIDQAALRSDLSERAQQSTRTMLTGLARSLGFERVTVAFDAPPPS